MNYPTPHLSPAFRPMQNATKATLLAPARKAGVRGASAMGREAPRAAVVAAQRVDVDALRGALINLERQRADSARPASWGAPIAEMRARIEAAGE